MTINDREVQIAGVDPVRLASIARRIERAAKEARAMGVTVFAEGSGGPGGCSLRFYDGTGKGALILADIFGGRFDGGDGGTMLDEDGLLRGEA